MANYMEEIEFQEKEAEAERLQKQKTWEFPGPTMDVMGTPANLLEMLVDTLTGGAGGMLAKKYMRGTSPTAHENIDGNGNEFPNKDSLEQINTLIEVDDNKDLYKLLDKVTRHTLWGQGHNIGDISGEFEGQRGSFLNQLSALRGGGEEDPMTPLRAAGPQVPFSEYSRDRNQYMPWLNQRYRDKQDIRPILEEFIEKKLGLGSKANDFTKKK